MELLFDPTQYLLGFRITESCFKSSKHQWKDGKFQEIEDNMDETANNVVEYYTLNINNYLREKGYKVIASIGGLHYDSNHPHIHYHLVIVGEKYPKNWIQNWKYHFTHNQPITPDWTAEQVETCSRSLHTKGKDKNKIQISIQGTPCNSGEDMEKFLAYPIKEGKHINNMMINVDSSFHYLYEMGTGLYKQAIAQRKIKDNSARKQLSVYTQVNDFLDKQVTLGKKDIRELGQACLYHFQTLKIKDQIDPQTLCKYVRKYCYYKGLWDVEEILDKYLL